MNLNQIEGNPQVEYFRSTPITSLAAELALPLSHFVHIESNGKNLLGDAYWNTFIEFGQAWFIGLKPRCP